jgi:hypothetical protein
MHRAEIALVLRARFEVLCVLIHAAPLTPDGIWEPAEVAQPV